MQKRTALLTILLSLGCISCGTKTDKITSKENMSKVTQSLHQAGIKENSEKYDVAYTQVSLLGPLGVDKALQTLMDAEKSGVLTKYDVSSILGSSTGTALAYYFDMSPVKFKAKALAAGITTVVEETGDATANAYQKTKNKVQGATERAAEKAQDVKYQMDDAYQTAKENTKHAYEISSEKLEKFSNWLKSKFK